MDNKNLFKEAIADAKAVREAALANAKAALEEALTPKLQSMLAAKLNEMEYEEEEELEEYAEMQPDRDMDGDGDIDADDVAKMKEVDMMSPVDTDDEIQDRSRATGAALEEEELEEEFDLSEILAELNEEETLNEAKEEEETEEEETEEEETEEVADMTVEDLKALIKDLIAQEMGGEKEAEEEPMKMGGEEASADEEEINLDELLAELDALGEGEDKDEMEEGILGKIGGAIKKGVEKVDLALGGSPKECIERGKKAGKEGSAEYFAELNKCRKEKGLTPLVSHTPGRAFGVKEASKEKEEMKEAIATINTLRAELNEVNLLNAKLLYVNKIFKAKNLSESQKLQVIASFDKATTAKEAKVVFESLNSTLTATPAKKAIKESLGFASKAAGIAPSKVIVESNDVIARMQKLANIK